MTACRSQRARRRPRRWVLGVVAVLTLLVVTAVPAAADDPARGQQWALDRIGADAAHATGQGTGIVIAVVDSGVDLGHEDLLDRLVPGIDVVDGDDRPQDGYGHGTHVAGIAAASSDNGRGIHGVAPRASIMPVRVLGDDGSGSTADVVAGIEWAVANGADVVNLSLGQAAQGIFGSSLSSAIEDAWAAGVVVVVSAGNDFVFSSGFGDEPAIVVSATTRNDGKPDYSNGVGNARWGMAAPGGGCALLTCATEDGILSTYWDEDDRDVYAYLSGTSMAAPHVAGAAAVLLSLGLSPRATVDRLLATAEDLGSEDTFGAGRLDLAAAVDGLDAAPATTSTSPSPSAPTPTPSPTGSPAGPSPSPTAAPTPSTTPAPPVSSSQGSGVAPSDDDAVPPSPSDAPASTPATPPASPRGTADDATAAGDVGEEPGSVGALPVTALLLLLGAGGTLAALAGSRRR